MSVIKIKHSLLSPEGYQTAQEVLGLSPGAMSLLLTVNLIVSEILHQKLLQGVETEEIYPELLPAFLGVPMSNHNAKILHRRLVSVAIYQAHDNSEAMLMMRLMSGGGEASNELVLLDPTDRELWPSNDETVPGEGGDFTILYPAEVACEHVKNKAKSCKPGHVHRSFFHLGPDAFAKYTEFKQRLSDHLIRKAANAHP